LFSRALHRSKKIVLEEAIYLEVEKMAVASWEVVPQEGCCTVLQRRTSAIAYAAGLFPWGSRPAMGGAGGFVWRRSRLSEACGATKI
jgi:hypothetical protein